MVSKTFLRFACALLCAFALIGGSPLIGKPSEEAAPPLAVAQVGDQQVVVSELGVISVEPLGAPGLPTSTIVAEVDLDDGTSFGLIGAGGVDLVPMMIAAIGALPAAASPVAAPDFGVSFDSHPKQPVISFDLMKEVPDGKGGTKRRYGRLSVEKLSGEKPEEHIKRAERELEKWEQQGWTTLPPS